MQQGKACHGRGSSRLSRLGTRSALISEIAGWFGILAPSGTPPAIAQRLREEVAKAVALPDVIAQLDSQGMLPLASQPNEWRDYLQSELDRYAKIIKDANIKPDDG